MLKPKENNKLEVMKIRATILLRYSLGTKP